MSSLRAQLTPGSDAQPLETEDTRLVETPKDRPAAPKAKDGDPPPKVRASTVSAVIIAALWAGAASAFLAGYFRAQAVAGLPTWDLQFLSFAIIVTILPPLMFIAAGYGIARAQAMQDAANRLAMVSERLTTADESAAGNAQRLGRTVRRELDAMSAGLDGVFGRMRAGAWRIVSVLGFTPELSSCALCHAPLPGGEDVTFSHAAGGVICVSCNRLTPGGRKIPGGARTIIGRWLESGSPTDLTDAEARSHQRLLREFLGAHLTDDRPLRAFAVWEHERWSAA